MAQQDGGAGKSPAAPALHSRFMVGSVSEENSEDENQGKVDLQLGEKENRSLSPSSCTSDSTFETGFDHVDGIPHNLRFVQYADAVCSCDLLWAFCYIFSLCDSSIF